MDLQTQYNGLCAQLGEVTYSIASLETQKEGLVAQIADLHRRKQAEDEIEAKLAQRTSSGSPFVAEGESITDGADYAIVTK